MIKWKPTFGRSKPIRPIEIDVGILNGDDIGHEIVPASVDDLASEAADRKTPGWKRKRTSASAAAKTAKASRKPSYRRTGR